MTKKIIIIVAIILFVIFTIRLLTPEDTWICQQGECLKHGHPSTEKPLSLCQ